MLDSTCAWPVPSTSKPTIAFARSTPPPCVAPARGEPLRVWTAPARGALGSVNTRSLTECGLGHRGPTQEGFLANESMDRCRHRPWSHAHVDLRAGQPACDGQLGSVGARVRYGFELEEGDFNPWKTRRQWRFHAAERDLPRWRLRLLLGDKQDFPGWRPTGERLADRTRKAATTSASGPLRGATEGGLRWPALNERSVFEGLPVPATPKRTR